MGAIVTAIIIIVILFLVGFLIAEDSISVRESLVKAFMVSLAAVVVVCILAFVGVVDVKTVFNEYPMMAIGFLLSILILYPVSVGIITALSNFTDIIAFIKSSLAAFLLLIVWPITFLFSLINKRKKRNGNDSNNEQ